MGLIEKEIETHYQQVKEAERLSNEWGELERLRTQAILGHYLPPAPAVILDVGGAAGAYAFPLAKQGYEVHLIDPVEKHVEQARAFAASSNMGLASIRKGDARHLEFASGRADAVLLLGPLYHLVEKLDRLKALAEARRILKTEGVLFAAGISRFASLIDGIARGFFRDPEFRKIVVGDLTRGLHYNATANDAYFTTAYFHRPEELEAELRESGFSSVELIGIEGPIWSGSYFRDIWNDMTQRQELLNCLKLTEREPSLLGASAHLMAVARGPN